MNQRKNNQSGITLIALILTILIMLILAGISLNAIVGENGIFNQASNAKILHEDSSAKEELELAWSARMVKFQEDVSKGKATFDDVYKYFTEDELNLMLGGIGKIHAMTFDSEKNEFDISYVSSDGVPYLGEIKSTGKIVKLERADQAVTEVWVSYYEGAQTLTYASSKELRLDGAGEPSNQWDISNGLKYNTVPWAPFKSTGGGTASVDTAEYIDKIKNVKVLDKITPKQTDALFYRLEYCENFEGLEKVDYSYCKAIGMLEFYYCSHLNNINIPNNVKDIKEFAFQGTHLTEVTIPENVSTIGAYAFETDTIKTVNYNAIKATNEAKIYNLNESATILAYPFPTSIENLIVGEKVESIYNFTFKNTKIKTLVIPDSVKIIGAFAFFCSNSLTSVDIGNNLIKIEESAFAGCSSLKEVNGGVALESIENYAFSTCSSLEKINGGTALKIIGEYAFAACSSLEKINIGTALQNIGEFAFYSCQKLSEFTFGNNLKDIGNCAFMYSGLVKVILADGLENIEDAAFALCNSLEEITIPSSVKKIGKSSFSKCYNVKTINYNATDPSDTELLADDGSSVLPAFSDSGTSELTINIQSNVYIIPSYLFWGCNVKNLNMYDGIIAIYPQVFDSCNNLEIVTIPSTMFIMSPYTFWRCTNLKKIIVKCDKESEQKKYLKEGEPWTNTEGVVVVWEP